MTEPEPIYVDLEAAGHDLKRPVLEVDAPPYTDDPDAPYVMFLRLTSRYVTADGEKVVKQNAVGLRQQDAVAIYAALGSVVNNVRGEDNEDVDTDSDSGTGPGVPAAHERRPRPTVPPWEDDPSGTV